MPASTFLRRRRATPTAGMQTCVQTTTTCTRPRSAVSLHCPGEPTATDPPGAATNQSPSLISSAGRQAVRGPSPPGRSLQPVKYPGSLTHSPERPPADTPKFVVDDWSLAVLIWFEPQQFVLRSPSVGAGGARLAGALSRAGSAESPLFLLDEPQLECRPLCTVAEPHRSLSVRPPVLNLPPDTLASEISGKTCTRPAACRRHKLLKRR